MMEYLRDNVAYPNADGVVRGIEVTDATSSAVDQRFRNEAIRVVQSMPKGTPGRQNEKPVNVQFSFSITFQMI